MSVLTRLSVPSRQHRRHGLKFACRDSNAFLGSLGMVGNSEPVRQS